MIALYLINGSAYGDKTHKQADNELSLFYPGLSFIVGGLSKDRTIKVPVLLGGAQIGFFVNSEVKKRVWGENDAVHLAINVITPFGHVLTHRPQPKHRSELYTSELLFISLAPN